MTHTAPTLQNQIAALHPMLLNFARRFVRNSADAEELAQETTMKALANIHQFTGGSLASWMFTILRNSFLTQCRLRRREPVGILDDASTLSQAVVAPQQSQIYIAEVQDAIGNLPKQNRDTLLLILDGVSYEDAATILGCEVGTIKSRVGRARAKLILRVGAENAADAANISP